MDRVVRLRRVETKFWPCRHINVNEDVMSPNRADTEADQSAPSLSNVIVTNQSRVACNGGGGPLGHPQVWLTLGTDGKVTCPYCSCAFVAAAE